MAIVHRKGKAYLDRSIRRGGRVTSEYVGAGELFASIGRLEAREREAAQIEREDWKAERERLDAEERAAAELFARVQPFADAAMVVAGYHQHKLQWRKRRG